MSFTVVKDSYPNIVKDGLVLNVDAGSRLSYSGSGTTWSDISGRGNNGTLTNGPTYSSANSGSIVFDGTNDYVNAPLTKSATCTFSCWARTTTLSAAGPMLFNAGPDGSGPDLYFNSGIISWNTWDGNSNPLSATTPASVTDGNYHHYVVVNDASSNTKLYYDGVLLGTASYRSAAANTNLTIGGNTNTYMWNGNISNFSIYNRALTAAEILQNYNALLPRFYSIVTSGLVLNLDAGNPNSYSPPRSDQYASSLVLAVPMNGANNGTTFTDQSATIRGSGTTKAITRNGSTQTLTAQSKFYGSSGFFDGTGDYLSIASSADFELGNGSFTLEAFVYANSWSTTLGGAGIISKGNVTSLSGDVYTLQVPNGIPQIFIFASSGSYFTPVVNSNTTLSVNTWYHIAVTRDGNNTRIFIDGVLKSTSTENYTISSGGSLYVGTQAYDPGATARSHNGYIQDLRIYKGVAKYTTNFKPPSISSGVTISSASGGVPILNTTDDYGTVNGSSGTTWSDISGNGNTGTLVNGPTYNGANYGSIVFDGSNDYVQTNLNYSLTSSTTEFTCASWYMCFQEANSEGLIFSNYQGNPIPFNLYANVNGKAQGFTRNAAGGANNVSVTSLTSVNDSRWHYVVYTKTGSDTYKLYVDGNLEATATASLGAISVSNTIVLGILNFLLNQGRYRGDIATAQIYNRALSAAEVSQNFNATKWRYGI